MAKKRPRANTPTPTPRTTSLEERQARAKIVPDPDGNFSFLRQPLPGDEVCDFCSTVPVMWTYPARDIHYSDLPGGGGSKGGWAACTKCHELIKKKEWSALTERSVESFSEVKAMEAAGMTKVQIRSAFRRMHSRFQAARTGPPFPHKSTFATDIDSETGTVTMSSPHGMEPEAIEDFIRSNLTAPLVQHRTLPPRPKWANARSFNKTWDSLLSNQPRQSDVAQGIPLSPGMTLSNFAFTPFVNAHLCVVDPELVMCMDDMPMAEMWRYAMRHKAPWDPVYLDFEGYGGVVPEVECAEGTAKIYGAVVWTPSEFGHVDGNARPNLAIAPIGGAAYLKAKAGWGFLDDGSVDHRTGITEQAERERIAWWEYVVMGIGLFGGISASKPIYVLGRDENSTGVDLVHVSRNGLAAFSGDKESEFLDSMHEGAILTCASIKDVAKENVQRGEWESQVLHHGDTIMRMCAKVMQTLFFIENAPIDIGPEQMSRQVRRNAQRKGEGIADIVTIRGKQAKSQPREEGTKEVEWSHRWLRRGYWRHLSDERYLRNRPDKVTPCDRMPPERCPNGECIKVRIDPVICGPDDKPFIAKSSVLKAGLPQK